MNRRKFLGFLGLGTVAAAVVPKLVSEEVEIVTPKMVSGFTQFGEAMTGPMPTVTTTGLTKHSAVNTLLSPDAAGREMLKSLKEHFDV